MLLTPLLLVADRPLVAPRLAAPAQRTTLDEIARAAGRAGHHRRLRPLRADRRPAAATPTACSATVLDHDADQVETRAPLRLAGLLRRRDAAGPAAHRRRRQAPACWCWPSTTSSRAWRWPSWCASTSRSCSVVARARNVSHYYRLRELGVELIERETLDSALMSARSVLELMGWQPPRGAQPGAALSPPQHRADGAHGAALRATRRS